MSGWESEDEDFMDDEDDLEDDLPQPAGPANPPLTVLNPSPSSQARPSPQRVFTQTPQNGTKRAIKVKPMSATMRNKWPDVVSCILTMANGRQVVFVRP